MYFDSGWGHHSGFFLINILILPTYSLEKDMRLLLLDNHLQVSFQGNGLDLGVYSPTESFILSPYSHFNYIF